MTVVHSVCRTSSTSPAASLLVKNYSLYALPRPTATVKLHPIKPWSTGTPWPGQQPQSSYTPSSFGPQVLVRPAPAHSHSQAPSHQALVYRYALARPTAQNYQAKSENYREKNKIFFVGILKVTDEKSWMEPDPHPDPLFKGTDPRIRIRTKMSRIRNTA
jgi:hypothetical protein